MNVQNILKITIGTILLLDRNIDEKTWFLIVNFKKLYSDTFENFKVQNWFLKFWLYFSKV